MTSLPISSNDDAPPSNWTPELERLAQAAEEELIWRECKRDPWFWMARFVKTTNENEPDSPPMPIDPRLHEYLEPTIETIHREPLVAIAKSRQMFMTWAICAYFLWTFLFRQGTRQFLQSKKQADANAILKRCADIYNALPEWQRERTPARITEDKIVAADPEYRSEIWAIPEGDNVIRSYTLTNLFSDEVAFQDKFFAMYKAMRPAMGAGAKTKVVLCSSTAPGAYCLVCHDNIDGPRIPPTETGELATGLKFHRNVRNKFLVLLLHYTADPLKRTTTWKTKAREGVLLESDWQQEYELNWTVRSGTLALPLLHQHETVIVISPFVIPEHWPRYVFSDYGIRHPYAHTMIAVGPGGQKIVYRDYEQPGPMGPHLEWLKGQEDYPLLRAKVLDRACWAQTQQVSQTIEGRTLHSTRSIAQMAQDDYGVDYIPAPKVSDVVKIQAFNTAWKDVKAGGQPGLVIFSTCFPTIRSLKAATWEEQTDKAQRVENFKETLVDEGNDPFDCVSYGLLFFAEEPVDAPLEMSTENAQTLFFKGLTGRSADRIAKGLPVTEDEVGDGLD